MIVDASGLHGTILVVDDTPASLSMLTAALEEAGFTVLVAQDGRKAIDIARRVAPAAILMDAIMPEMDGFQAAIALKRIEALRDVPVLFMTGLSETEHVVRGLEAGGVDYVTKPVDPEELIARLRVHIANARSAQNAQVALDASGRFLLSVDLQGALRWATPHAQALLHAEASQSGGTDSKLPDGAVAWLAAVLAQPARSSTPETEYCASIGGKTLRFSYVGAISASEHLLRVVEDKGQGAVDMLREAFQLTSREAEVLSWIANGKSNKEIAVILDMSPRTVNKHLDRIFGKLGVENRTSAAIVSLKKLLEA